jgi:hypothetical protein
MRIADCEVEIAGKKRKRKEELGRDKLGVPPWPSAPCILAALSALDLSFDGFLGLRSAPAQAVFLRAFGASARGRVRVR